MHFDCRINIQHFRRQNNGNEQQRYIKRVRYALDIRDIDMVEIFKLGGMEVTKEDVVDMLTK